MPILFLLRLEQDCWLVWPVEESQHWYPPPPPTVIMLSPGVVFHRHDMYRTRCSERYCILARMIGSYHSRSNSNSNPCIRNDSQTLLYPPPTALLEPRLFLPQRLISHRSLLREPWQDPYKRSWYYYSESTTAKVIFHLPQQEEGEQQ